MTTLLTTEKKTPAPPVLDFDTARADVMSGKALTPLTPSRLVEGLFYKREDLTATKAYKVRGATVAMKRAMQQGYQHFTASSTGNHAMGVLKAAEVLKPASVTVVVSNQITSVKARRLIKTVNTLQVNGQSKVQLKVVDGDFEAAQQLAKELGAAPAAYYIDPYADPNVVAGQGTIGLELFEQLSPLLSTGNVGELTVVAAVGGGGLLNGTTTALTQALSKAAQRLPALAAIRLNVIGLRLADPESVLGDAIRVKAMNPDNRQMLVAQDVFILDVLNDAVMQDGIDFIREDLGKTVEGAAGGTLYPLLNQDPTLGEKIAPSKQNLVVCIISGANVDADMNLDATTNLGSANTCCGKNSSETNFEPASKKPVSF